MRQWSAETESIISRHSVTSDTYKATMDAAGGFDAFVVSLGGVFAKWHGRTEQAKTVQEVRERDEYVHGLMFIFCFCYWNGGTWHFWLNDPAKAFYSTKQTKSCPSGTIAQLCTGAGGKTRITNCNYGIDTLSKALGYPIWSCDWQKMLDKGAQKITVQDTLCPGDLVHFFTKSGEWRHVAMVHSIEDGVVWLSDYGSRFIKTGKPLHAFPSEYTNYPTWLGVRYMDLENEKVKDTNDLAVELKREIDSYLAFNRQAAGEDVYSTMIKFRSDRDAYLRAAADYVLDGHAGTGEARQVFFGEDYTDVQNKVNWVLAMTRDVIAGIYGSGETRKARLGPDYDVIQAQVNRQLRR